MSASVAETAQATLRFGVLSRARINEELLPGFRRSAAVELAAVASRAASDAQAYADAHGIPRAHGSYEDLLADPAIDCVYVPLPNALHGAWVERALAEGKHVLCEKPLTETAAEAERLFAHAEQADLVLAEAFMYRHHPQTLAAERLVRAGALGELRTIQCAFSFRVADPASDIRYRADLAGGALRDVGCYCVSLANLLAGDEPADVQGAARMADTGVDAGFHGQLRYASGLVAQFECGIDTQLTLGARVIGADGELTIPVPWYPHQPPMTIALRRGATVETIPVPGENAYQLELEDFAAAVRGETAPRVSAAETVRNLRTIDRLRASAGLS